MSGDDLTRARKGNTEMSTQYDGSPTKIAGQAVARWAGGVSPVPEDEDGSPLCWKCCEAPPNNNVPGALCHPCWEKRIRERDRMAAEDAERENHAWRCFREAWRKLGLLTDAEQKRRDRDELERRFLKAMPHYRGLCRRWVLEGYGDRQAGESGKGGKGKGWG